MRTSYASGRLVKRLPIMSLTLAAAAILAVPAVAAAPPAAAPSIVDLGRLPSGQFAAAYDINSRGQVVGVSFAEGADQDSQHAVLWENGTITDLGGANGSNWSDARAINEQGQIAVTSMSTSGSRHAFLWENGLWTDLGTLPGGTSSWADDINNRGDVVGGSSTPTGNHAVLWRRGAMLDLGTLGGRHSIAWGINDAGTVVGSSESTTGGPFARPFVWRDGTMRELSAPGPLQAQAAAINNRGDIVGFVRPGFDTVAAIWHGDTMTMLPTPSDCSGTTAIAINERGEIVGYCLSISVAGGTRALLWRDGSVIELGTLPPPLNPEGTDAKGINDRGQIVGGAGTMDEFSDAVLWTR